METKAALSSSQALSATAARLAPAIDPALAAEPASAPAASWSPWSRCESSFSMLLVPSRPGVFALAEEIVAPGAGSKRMLAILDASDTDDLARTLSRLFAADSLWRDRLVNARCFVRFAIVADPVQRAAVAASLRHWLSDSSSAAAAIAAPTTSPSSQNTSSDRSAPEASRPAPPAFPSGF